MNTVNKLLTKSKSKRPLSYWKNEIVFKEIVIIELIRFLKIFIILLQLVERKCHRKQHRPSYLRTLFHWEWHRCDRKSYSFLFGWKIMWIYCRKLIEEILEIYSIISAWKSTASQISLFNAHSNSIRSLVADALAVFFKYSFCNLSIFWIEKEKSWQNAKT